MIKDPMNKFFVFFTLLIITACGSTRQSAELVDEDLSNRPDGLKTQLTVEDNSAAAQASGLMNEVVRTTFSDSVRMKELVTYLASDELEGRDSGSEGIEKAAAYIESYFEQFGIRKYFETYRDTLANYKNPSFNIVGLVPGTDKKLADQHIIIGAHYDHIGIISSAMEDKIANGANDNASGTATVMELARYFGSNRTNKRSILFVLFSAEEKGLLGSGHLAKRLLEEGLDLYAMLNFEMTGVPMKEREYLLYLTGYEISNLAELCNQYAGENLIGFLEQAKAYQLFQRSDNFPFHKMFNVPSQTYCSFDFTNYDYYHKVGDEAFRLDYAHMARVVNKMIPVVEGLAGNDGKEVKYY